MFGRTMGIALLITSILLLTVAFTGPYAFVRRPTLILAPIYAPNLDRDQIGQIRRVLEREIAAEGTHNLYPKSLIENFYLEKDNKIDVFDGRYLGKQEAFRLAQELNVERTAIVSVLKYNNSINISIKIYDLKTDQLLAKAHREYPSMEELLNWRDDNQIDLLTDIGESVAGMSVGAWMYICWLIMIALAGILLLFTAKGLGNFIEALLSIGLLLSLFSWIYALNGDMDYVQRFVATSGILHINDTQTERMVTLIRYLLPMILLAIQWCYEIKKCGSLLNIRSAAPFAVIISALLYTLCLPNFLVLKGLPFLAWFALTPLYIVLRRVKFWRGMSLMMLFTGLQTLLINWWQGTFSYVSLPFTVGLTLVQYLPFALVLVFTLRFWPRGGLMAAPFLWVAFDWIRSFGFLAYPWGLLGVSQYSNTGLIQIASFGGVWLVSLFTHFSCAVLASAVERMLESRQAGKPIFTPSVWIPTALMASLIIIISFGGRMVIAFRDASREGESVRILGVQQNTDPRKHDYHLSFQELSQLTEAALEQYSSFDLIAWPESGFVPDIRFWLDEKRSKWKRGKLVRRFLNWQSTLAMPLVTGTQDHYYQAADPEDIKHILNSSMYLPPERRDDFDRYYYYKMRLVPFTENFPYSEQFPWVAKLLHNFSTTQWTPGKKYTVHQAPKFRFATPICFEDIFPDHVRRFVLEGADILVNISNDYWANTPLEGYQHAVHAVFRAVENRRPLVRATSSGWTITVDPEGRIGTQWPEFYTPGFVVGEFTLPPSSEMSFYTRFGDWVPVMCLFIWCVLLAFFGDPRLV